MELAICPTPGREAISDGEEGPDGRCYEQSEPGIELAGDTGAVVFVESLWDGRAPGAQFAEASRFALGIGSLTGFPVPLSQLQVSVFGQQGV